MSDLSETRLLSQPPKCHFPPHVPDYPVVACTMSKGTFELLWGGTINCFPCMLGEYVVGARVEMTEVEWLNSPTPTGRELYGWVTNVACNSAGCLVTMKFSGRTFAMRSESDVHGKKQVPYPMSHEPAAG